MGRRSHHYLAGLYLPSFIIGGCILIILLAAQNSHGAEWPIQFQGQLSGWTQWSRNQGEWEHHSGLRYLPGFYYEQPVGKAARLGIEATLNGWLSLGSAPVDETAEVALYRAAGWFSTARTETVIGLQKITFGPARLLRPLQWFDRIDPTDPLGFTRGAYGLRLRYLARNNANGWFWCLYPNEDINGLEQLPTRDTVPQWGGRIQTPALQGEMAVSVNWRQVDGAGLGIPDFEEKRLAWDGRWDLGVGLWFETVWQHQAAAALRFDWTKMVMAGVDYTFGRGNGLYCLFEQMALAASGSAWTWDETRWISALMLSYPLNFIDALQFIGSHDWQAGQTGVHLQWQRTYDRVVFNLALFDYPPTGEASIGAQRQNPVAGTGVMVMVIFNH